MTPLFYLMTMPSSVFEFYNKHFFYNRIILFGGATEGDFGGKSASKERTFLKVKKSPGIIFLRVLKIKSGRTVPLREEILQMHVYSVLCAPGWKIVEVSGHIAESSITEYNSCPLPSLHLTVCSMNELDPWKVAITHGADTLPPSSPRSEDR